MAEDEEKMCLRVHVNSVHVDMFFFEALQVWNVSTDVPVFFLSYLLTITCVCLVPVISLCKLLVD